MIMCVNIFKTEIMVKICSKSLVRAISRVLLMKIGENLIIVMLIGLCL